MSGNKIRTFHTFNKSKKKNSMNHVGRLKGYGNKSVRMLYNVYKEVEPVMKKYNWSIQSLEELKGSKNSSLYGLNCNRRSILIRLRGSVHKEDMNAMKLVDASSIQHFMKQSDLSSSTKTTAKSKIVHITSNDSGSNLDGDWFEFDNIVDTMLHELVHMEISEHSVEFYDMLNKLRREVEDIRFRKKFNLPSSKDSAHADTQSVFETTRGYRLGTSSAATATATYSSSNLNSKLKRDVLFEAAKKRMKQESNGKEADVASNGDDDNLSLKEKAIRAAMKRRKNLEPSGCSVIYLDISNDDDDGKKSDNAEKQIERAIAAATSAASSGNSNSSSNVIIIEEEERDVIDLA